MPIYEPRAEAFIAEYGGTTADGNGPPMSGAGPLMDWRACVDTVTGVEGDVTSMRVCAGDVQRVLLWVFNSCLHRVMSLLIVPLWFIDTSYVHSN